MKKEVNFLLDNGLAEPSLSPWASPCLLTPKPDGSSRFCTDYRKVNQVTIPDSYPLPLIEDLIDNIGQAKFISTVDLLKGYYQIGLPDSLVSERSKRLGEEEAKWYIYIYIYFLPVILSAFSPCPSGRGERR